MRRLVFALCVPLACGDAAHPEPIGDFIEPDSPNECAKDAGDCASPSSRVPGAVGQGFSCLSEEQAAEFDEPLSSVVAAFDSDLFFPTETKPISGKAWLRTLGEIAGTLACVEVEAGTSFELYGGNRGDDGGGLRIDPIDHDNFHPTMIQRVQRYGRSYTVIPVVATAELDRIFSDLGRARDPDKAQILIELATVDSSNQRERVAGIRIQSAAAEAVAYRDVGQWTTELDATTVQGLAVLINVNSGDDLGRQITVKYQDTFDDGAEPEDIPDQLYAITGGVTYLAFTPPR